MGRQIRKRYSPDEYLHVQPTLAARHRPPECGATFPGVSFLKVNYLWLRRAFAATRRARALGYPGFRSCGPQALEHRLRSRGAWASLPRGMWGLPGAGIEPVSPALPGGLFPTEPAGKPYWYFLIQQVLATLTSNTNSQDSALLNTV